MLYESLIIGQNILDLLFEKRQPYFVRCSDAIVVDEVKGKEKQIHRTPLLYHVGSKE